ncbi:uncharacterized protein LOC131165428 isoform X4 [Malania oleifera]|uniref:uncharacterized protein LOC131165428 isoform X4 n=1 Tax=Malania oleifera TaxID=397392 RepID=UPI0025AE0C4A|nr:uncharacterized protein LOC131165428 isoform X4 [Malania oleifera]
MASALIAPKSICSTNLLHNSCNLAVSLVPINFIAVNSTKSGHKSKLKHLPRASSSEGVPTELIEDSKFVPLNADDPRYGPPALLLLGFEVQEAVKVIYGTEEMINRPLWEVMNTKQTNLEALKIAKSLPRICFLSGLSGEEMMMFIDAFPETGLEPAVFAALVPNSADKPLQELIEEIMGDHDMLSAKKSG